MRLWLNASWTRPPTSKMVLLSDHGCCQRLGRHWRKGVMFLNSVYFVAEEVAVEIEGSGLIEGRFWMVAKSVVILRKTRFVSRGRLKFGASLMELAAPAAPSFRTPATLFEQNNF